MPIVNLKDWEKAVEVNKDPYGKACVDVARRVMEIMDEDLTPFHEGYHPDVHTTHGIICKADKDIDAGGITGFMAGCVASMVSACHSRGEEFRKAWNHDNGIKEKNDKGGVFNPAILT